MMGIVIAFLLFFFTFIVFRDIFNGTDKAQELIRACADVSKLKILLKKGADVNTEYNGTTPLTSAVVFTNLECIELLLQNGADTEFRNQDGWTILMGACGRGRSLEIIRILLKYGANVNAKSNDGYTPLMIVATFDTNPKVIQVLIDHGADVNVKNNDGGTALMGACMHNSNSAVIETLLRNGANVNVQDQKGMTAMAYIGLNPDLDIDEIYETFVKYS